MDRTDGSMDLAHGKNVAKRNDRTLFSRAKGNHGFNKRNHPQMSLVQVSERELTCRRNGEIWWSGVGEVGFGLATSQEAQSLFFN